MTCAPVGEKRDSSCLLNDTELSDSSNSSFSDDYFLCHESDQEEATGSSSTRVGRRDK